MPVEGAGWVTRGPGWVTLGSTSTYTLTSAAQVYTMGDVTWTTTGTGAGVINTWTTTQMTTAWTTASMSQWNISRSPHRLDPGEEEQAAREQEAHWLEQDALQREWAEARRDHFDEQRQAEDVRQLQVAGRAKELLLAHLDAQQKRDILEHGWFEVISDKGRRWRIRLEGIVGNVDLMPTMGDRRVASYCAHGAGILPFDDHYLAQKLALESDEASFLAVANEHW